jgi:hypothetical protein
MAETTTEDHAVDPRCVRRFRQVLLWPLRLMPLAEGARLSRHWEVLRAAPWHEVEDEITGDPAQFHERHYSEFVTFLPHVQRFLYGEGKSRARHDAASPIRVFRREDVRAVRLTHPDAATTTLEVVHVDLYFFHDLDVVILAFEAAADDLALERAQDVLFRFGRSYPTYWNDDGSAGHCMHKVEWLAEDGAVLATSDHEQRERFLAWVTRHRAPCIAAHWEFLLRPLVPQQSDASGPVRYSLLEFHRMPVMGYLAVEDLSALTRPDFVRLGLVTPPGEESMLPCPEAYARDFEQRHCYDRYWHAQGAAVSGTRFIASGYAFFMVGSASEPFFVDRRMGLVEQFRRQYLLLFLIPHLQKAALLMLADRLAETLNRLDIHDPDSVRRFKRDIRLIKETFLRFSHRYWFHDLSDQEPAKAVYCMARDFLGAQTLFDEVREEIADMSDYLDSDSLRRQANTVVRLTVVTIFGLIGTVVTGFLGMNLFALAEEGPLTKLLVLVAVLVPTIWLTFYTIAKSKRLSDFLELLTEERVPWRVKLAAFFDVWRHRRWIE